MPQSEEKCQFVLAGLFGYPVVVEILGIEPYGLFALRGEKRTGIGNHRRSVLAPVFYRQGKVYGLGFRAGESIADRGISILDVNQSHRLLQENQGVGEIQFEGRRERTDISTSGNVWRRRLQNGAGQHHGASLEGVRNLEEEILPILVQLDLIPRALQILLGEELFQRRLFRLRCRRLNRLFPVLAERIPLRPGVHLAADCHRRQTDNDQFSWLHNANSIFLIISS